MTPVYCALLHFPVRNRAGETVTASVTNLDIHDISRLACTYGLEGYFIVSPIEAHRELVARILEHWTTGAGKRRMPERSEALALCRVVATLEQACTLIQNRHASAPRLLATAAGGVEGGGMSSYETEASRLTESERPVLVLFGTSHGLAPSVLERVDAVLEPVRGATDYNHLSVRTAAAIVLDRLLGRR